MPLIGKVAVVIGGTNGIGKAIAKNLALKRCDVNIIGKSDDGLKCIDELYQHYPNGNHSFLKIDVSEMSNIRNLNTDHIKKVNYLIQSQGTASITRKTTNDGIDLKMALHYYSRILFIMKFLPNILSHQEDKVILSILSAGVHSTYTKFDDIDLKNNNYYSISNIANAAGYYNDLILDKLSKTYPNISFQHAAPGFVNTNWGKDFPSLLLIPLRYIQKNFAMTPENCAKNMVDGMLIRKNKAGFHLFDQKGNDTKKTNQHTDEYIEKLWIHTNEFLKL